VLGTLDPRIPGLGAWQPVDMANSGAITIDLSSYSFAGEPATAADDTLSPAELNDLINAITEAESENYPDPGDQLSDDELTALMQAAEGDQMNDSDPFSEFNETFSARAQAEQDRQQAREAFDALDMIRPARRAEDKVARVMARAQAGLYDGQEMAFSAEQAAVEIILSNGGSGPCGVTDSYGRCAERYHALGCSHDQGTDWLAQQGGPPRSTYQASLANFGAAMEMTSSASSGGWTRPRPAVSRTPPAAGRTSSARPALRSACGMSCWRAWGMSCRSRNARSIPA
jgi:hypothetical protein